MKEVSRYYHNSEPDRKKHRQQVQQGCIQEHSEEFAEENGLPGHGFANENEHSSILYLVRDLSGGNNH